ncbi:MAG: sugar phosphate isomerase/epimerase [Planctomycetota bacterium]|nr:sugar phosphate isomerase/epimerase [Planctomycetota bacterium]
MKLAFSSIGCPGWDLATMVQKAKEFGFAGIELRGLQGQMNLPLAPELASNPTRVGDLMRETGIELVCLAGSASFHMSDPKKVAESQAQAREYIDLAGALGCPFVRVNAGEIPKARFIGYERRETVLGRIAKALRELAPYAADRRVTLLVENGGDFADSASIWFLVDACDSPAVKCCWSPFAACTRNERPTTSIPRLGVKIGLLRLCDGKFNDSGAFDGYVLPGQGSIEIPRLIQLLKGVAFGGYLVFDWPKLWVSSLAEPDKALPAAAAYLKPLLDEKPLVMTAYKGDKHAPRYPDTAAAK